MGRIRRDAGDCISLFFSVKETSLSAIHTFQWLAWNIGNRWDKSDSFGAAMERFSSDKTGSDPIKCFS
jgi:hypothetical protein